MANANKIILIGRLGKDPETRSFANGGKVAQFSICVTNRKKNQSTGQYEDDPCWLDVKGFNSQNGGKTADLAEQYLRKGHQVYIEGHMVQEKWTTQEGANRSKLVVLIDSMQFLEKKPEGGQPAPVNNSRQPQQDPPDENGEIPF